MEQLENEYYKGFNELIKVSQYHSNYSNWIINTFLPFIGEEILEIGSGTGNFTNILVKKGLKFGIFQI